MPVRAKMRCESLEISNNSSGEPNGGTVRLSPVVSGSEENKRFFQYTPGGVLILNTINKAAFDQFHLGEEYFVDITPAVAPPEAGPESNS